MAGGPPETERERLEREIERLRMKRHQLDLALGEFLHEGRRTRDALERAGGHSHALEAKARGLKTNAEMTRRELGETGREIERLRRRLAEIDTSGPG
jgi:chromosome segregation ATPase